MQTDRGQVEGVPFPLTIVERCGVGDPALEQCLNKKDIPNSYDSTGHCLTAK